MQSSESPFGLGPVTVVIATDRQQWFG